MSEPETGWLLIKRGLYWRPNSAGYTGIKDLAGRYSKHEASSLLSDETAMVHEDFAPDYSNKCWPEVKAEHLQEKLESTIAAQASEIKELREAMEQKMEVPFKVISILREQERKLMHEAENKMLHFVQEEDAKEISFWSTKMSRHQHAFATLNSVQNGIIIGTIPAGAQLDGKGEIKSP